MKLLKAQADLLESAINEPRKGAMVAPYKDGIVFAIPDHASMGYFIPKDKLKVVCKPLDRMPFQQAELDIIEESNRLVETNIEQKLKTVKATIRQFVFAHDMTGEGVWLNAKFLQNFEHYTLYQNPKKPKSLILVTEGEGTIAGIIMPYNLKKI